MTHVKHQERTSKSYKDPSQGCDVLVRPDKGKKVLKKRPSYLLNYFD